MPLIDKPLAELKTYQGLNPRPGDFNAYWAAALQELDATDPKIHSVDFQSMLIAGRVGTAAAVKFRVWLDYYRHVEPLVDKLWAKGEAPPMNDMSIDKQLVCAISAVNMVAQECRKPTKTASDRQALQDSVHKGAKNVFGWVKQLSGEFQIGAVKSTLNMKLIQDFQLTKIPEVMSTYLNVRKAMKD